MLETSDYHQIFTYPGYPGIRTKSESLSTPNPDANHALVRDHRQQRCASCARAACEPSHCRALQASSLASASRPGFIASHLVTKMLEQGHSIRATVRHEPEAPQLECLRALQTTHPNKLTIHKVDDLTNVDALVEVFRGCDGIFHMAAVVRPIAIEPPTSAAHASTNEHM